MPAGTVAESVQSLALTRTPAPLPKGGRMPSAAHAKTKCGADSCERDAQTRGLCYKHYQRERSAGRLPDHVPMNQHPCMVPGCDRRAFVRWLCRTHYERVSRHGDVRADRPIQEPQKGRVCAVDGCAEAACSKGLCKRHYQEDWKVARVGCAVEGCDEAANSFKLCPRHYQRLRKYGHPLAGPAFRARRGTGEPPWLRAHRRREPQARANANLLEYISILRGDPCSYCGARVEHIDHIVPVAAGGSLVVDNVTGACRSCNVRKSHTPLLHFLLRPRVADAS